jgi:hypothetical protein
MINTENYKNMDDLNNYLEACKNGNTEMNPEIFHDIYRSNKYYINQGLLVACKLNHTDVVSYILKEIKVGFKYQIDEVLEDKSEEEKNTYTQRRMFNYVVELFRANIPDICKCSAEIVKLFTQELGGIPNTSDFGNCLKASSAAGNLPLIKHFLSTDEHKIFIEQWKYYNNYLDTKKEANEVIKYFIDHAELKEHIKPLQLFQNAYQSNNQELIEYFIFDCNMLYSKKTRKTVEYMTDGVCNVPHLFQNRDKILLAQQLQEDLSDKEVNSRKIKI